MAKLADFFLFNSQKYTWLWALRQKKSSKSLHPSVQMGLKIQIQIKVLNFLNGKCSSNHKQVFQKIASLINVPVVYENKNFKHFWNWTSNMYTVQYLVGAMRLFSKYIESSVQIILHPNIHCTLYSVNDNNEKCNFASFCQDIFHWSPNKKTL